MTDTLCWACENACGRCSWSQKKSKPVPGWEAMPTQINVGRGAGLESYTVLRCPQFEWDGRTEYAGMPEKQPGNRAKKPQKPWTHDEIVKMHELRKAGMTWPKVAQALGRTIDSVRGQRPRLERYERSMT